ncbi:MAG: Do family serine endopeptidase [Bacteroidales bacterium]|jgi:Do/DeqQ family serine protease|nr:Do family serine endopeptidase [Bacteroidales bacterium]
MKAKHVFGAFIMAALGSVITLYVYAKYLDRPFAGWQGTAVRHDSSSVEDSEAKTFWTSFQMSDGQVDFTYAAEQTVHAVVHVHTKKMVEGYAENPIFEWFYGERYSNSRPREVRGYGSGVIISDDGYIITNNHVIEGADEVDVVLNDKRTMKAKVTGRDPSTDIALLKVEATGLPYIKYGDSDALKLGEWVLAVGNPFNLTSTVTAGIVSAKGRSLGMQGDYMIESFIQTDAALNMGNSGGALVNTKGLLVGITSAILSPSGAYAGNSFAIPTTIVRKVVDDLRQYGEVQRALIGIHIRDVKSDDAEKFKLNKVTGVVVTGTAEGGAAAAAGLKADDVIIALDNVEVHSVAELQEQVGKHRPGDKVTVKYIRGGKEQTAQLTLKNVAGNTDVVTAGMGTDTAFGAKLAAVGSEEKREFNITNGVKVMEVGDGKFKDIGIRKGYIIVSINDKKVNSASDVRQFTNNESTLKSIGGVQPNGTIFSYKFGN